MAQLAQQMDLSADDYRLERFDVEVRGRLREFVRSVVLLLLLFSAQQPLRTEALKAVGQTPYIDPVTSLRISLILDVLFMITYVLVAYRAWGLVRAFRAPRRLAATARGIAYFVVPALFVLDAAENLYLVGTFTGNDAVTSLTWGKSQLVLQFGLGAALGVSVLLVAFTNPKVYWDRRPNSVSIRSPKWLVKALTRLPNWLDRQLRWFVTTDDIRRWRGVLTPRHHDGSCTCGGTVPSSSPLGSVARDWGVICCSGGGVRSAAFSLGGLQALNAHELYEKSEAVVGVSGGGYTSTAFHAVRWQSGGTEEKKVDHDKVWTLPTGEAFGPPSPELQWLRRHTHYVLDSARVAFQGALTLGFGIAANLILLAVAIGATAWFLAWLYLASGTVTLPLVQFHNPELGGSIHLDVGGDWWWLQHVWFVPAAGLTLFALEQAVDRFATIPHHVQMRLRIDSTRLIAGGTVLCALLLGLPALIAALFDYADTSGSVYADLIYSLGIVPQDHCTAVLRAGSKAACGEKVEPDGLSGVGTVSIVTVVTSILAVLASVRSASKSQAGGSGVGGFLKKVWAKIKDPVVPWLAVSLIVFVCALTLIRGTAILTIHPDRLDDWRLALWAAGTLLALKVFSEPNRTSLHHFFRERIAYAFLVRRRFSKIQSLPYNVPLRFSRSRPPLTKGPRLVTCAVANASDPTLIPSQRGCTPFVFDDERIGLTDRLLPRQSARRASATYEFAADHGYRDATIPAAVAMSAAAFSPLAGRENVRLGPYRAVLALGNARLGVWLPNPLWVDAAQLALRQAKLRDPDFTKTWDALSCQEAKEVYNKLGSRRLWAHKACVEASPAPVSLQHSNLWGQAPLIERSGPAAPAEVWRERYQVFRARARRFGEAIRTIFKKPGMTRVVREAVGQASIYDRFLYVTDGGHYDNLGLIEALRRKPRRIFVIDASNDAEDTFRALGIAVATARMDLDCELQLDPRRMRRLEEQRSAAAWCTGTATWPDGSTCAIYLVKAIMLDDMPWDVETYAASNLDFPRTSTGKQLYSELDFEAYRMLGTRATEELLTSNEYLGLEADVARDEAEVATDLRRKAQARLTKARVAWEQVQGTPNDRRIDAELSVISARWTLRAAVRRETRSWSVAGWAREAAQVRNA